MNKRRLIRMLDIMLALTLFSILELIDNPYPCTLRGFWAMHRTIFRAGASGLWLIALWLSTYRALDRAECLSRAALIWGGALMVCLLGSAYGARLITLSTKARLSQELYGLCAIATAASCLFFMGSLARANEDVPGCASACASARLRLCIALGALVGGLIGCALVRPRAMYYFVAAAALFLIVSWMIGWPKTEAAD